MDLAAFIKAQLEAKYLGATIKSQLNGTPFVVHNISVVYGGADPQMEIVLESKLHAEDSEAGRFEHYYMSTVNDKMPEIVSEAPNPLDTLVTVLKQASKKHDGGFYPAIRYADALRWVKLARRGAIFSFNPAPLAKDITWQLPAVEPPRLKSVAWKTFGQAEQADSSAK